MDNESLRTIVFVSIGIGFGLMLLIVRVYALLLRKISAIAIETKE